jgi:hypothetical protein
MMSKHARRPGRCLWGETRFAQQVPSSPAPVLGLGVRRLMPIDKNSTGLPEINVHKRTTKVNLWMVGSVLFFFAVMAGVAVWVSRERNHAAGSDAVGQRPISSHRAAV